MTSAEGETGPVEDAVLGGRVRLLQPARGYRAAIDPVLLAAAVPAGRGQSVIDVGCGVGTAMLCLARRVADVRVVGLDLQPEILGHARRNIALNGFDDRAEALEGDLLAPPPGLKSGGFDHVLANPPFLESGRGRSSPVAAKAAATVEGQATLDDWLRFCVRMGGPRASVTVIHRADRLADLLAAMTGRLGALKVFPLWPAEGQPARRILVQGRKGSAAPLEVLPGLVLHRPDGAYTEPAEAILRHGGALAF